MAEATEAFQRSERGMLGPVEGARDHLPLLQWLLVNALAAFGFLATWWFGLLGLMLQNDRSYISLVILLIYLGMTAVCFLSVAWISREGDAARRVADVVRRVEGRLVVQGERVRTQSGETLEPCEMTRHIRNLIVKTRIGGAGQADQSVLLQALAERLKSRQRIGLFVAGVLFKLGLLGTVIGFILMLSPISAIDAMDAATMKDALTTMSGGMAVALFTTLAGLVAGVLLGVQYYLLDQASARLFAHVLETTEVYVAPRLAPREGARE
jgi:biopolymer transport protein ExbB/TolQ